MFDEGAFRKNDVTPDKTAEFKFHDIDLGKGPPALIIAPGFEVNKPYWNGRLKMHGRGRRDVTADVLGEERDNDRALYPQFVVKGWENVCDKSGKDVPFDMKTCAEFLKLLPDWQFDDLRNFAGSPLSFVNTVNFDTEQVAKNSESGSSGS